MPRSSPSSPNPFSQLGRRGTGLLPHPSWARAGVKAKQPCSGRDDLIHLLNPDLVVVEILALQSLAD
jgi:hypothetical protein